MKNTASPSTPSLFSNIVIQKLWYRFKSWARLGIIFYLLVFLAFKIVVDENKVIIKTLNESIPDMSALAGDLRGQGHLNSEELGQYIEYFQLIIRHMPDSMAAHQALGYCYTLEKEYKKAIHQFQKAVELNPRAFWPYYNLGILLYQQGRYAEAATVLVKAIATNPKETLTAIMGSKICEDLVKIQPAVSTIQLSERLDQGYQQAYLLRLLCYYRTRQFPLMAKTAEALLQMPALFSPNWLFYAGVANYELNNCQKAVLFMTKYMLLQPQEGLSFEYLSRCAEINKETFWSKEFTEKAKMLNKGTLLETPPFELKPKIF